MPGALKSLFAALAVAATVAAGGPAVPPTRVPVDPVAVPVALPVAEAAAAAGEQVRVASWNICGEAGGTFGQAGYCPYRNEPNRKVDAVLNLVNSQQLNVVMLQEVCSGPLLPQQTHGNVSFLDRLQARLGAQWQIAWVEHPRPGGRSDCRGTIGGTLSTAIAVKGTILTTFRGTVPVPHGSRQTDVNSQPSMLCVQVTGWSTEVCTTHLINNEIGEANYAKEIATVIDFIAARPAGYPHVVLGGDLNTRRWDTWLTALHDRWDECDERSYGAGDVVREPTINSVDDPGKIDYIFASAGFVGCDVLTTGYQDTSTTATPNGFSDHAPIVGLTRPLA
jgi:endonuclease/exonuclease/phosphatase family metal-dependent hydrolase